MPKDLGSVPAAIHTTRMSIVHRKMVCALAVIQKKGKGTVFEGLKFYVLSHYQGIKLMVLSLRKKEECNCQFALQVFYLITLVPGCQWSWIWTWPIHHQEGTKSSALQLASECSLSAVFHTANENLLSEHICHWNVFNTYSQLYHQYSHKYCYFYLCFMLMCSQTERKQL